MDIKNKILQIIKQAFCSLNDKDSSVYPRNQISYNGKASLGNRGSIYGYCYNPPAGTWGLSLSSQGKESTKFVFFNELNKRKKNLQPGEVAIHNPTNGSYVYLRNNGDIEIKSNGALKLESEGELTHNGVNIGATHIHDAGIGPGTLYAGTTKVTGKTSIPE